jgi:hypothetical protein
MKSKYYSEDRIVNKHYLVFVQFEAAKAEIYG